DHGDPCFDLCNLSLDWDSCWTINNLFLDGCQILSCNRCLLPQIWLLIKAREVKRLDAILRSDVYSHFAETLAGLTIIRAYGKQDEFSSVNDEALDIMNRAYFIAIVNQCWLGVRLDFV